MDFLFNMASKRPQRSDMTSDLKFVDQMIYDTTFCLGCLGLYSFVEEKIKKKKKMNRHLLDLSASPQVKTRACKHNEPARPSHTARAFNLVHTSWEGGRAREEERHC